MHMFFRKKLLYRHKLSTLLQHTQMKSRYIFANNKPHVALRLLDPASHKTQTEVFVFFSVWFYRLLTYSSWKQFL